MVSVFLNSSELPVTLATFKAMVQEQPALLTWSTSKEVNFSHFEIQRSADARQWQQIGGVAAAGGSGVSPAYRSRLSLQRRPAPSQPVLTIA